MHQWHKEHEDCHCAVCEQGIDQVLEQQQGYMVKFGWFAHAVTDEKNATGFNYHTHGLPESFDHLDLQITLPVDPLICHGIAVTIIERITKGEKFKDGQVDHKVIEDYPVKFINATECERPVLRIILPDEQGNLERKEMSLNLALQYVK